MKTEVFDVTVSDRQGGVYIEPHTSVGEECLNTLFSQVELWGITLENIREHIPPNVKVGMRTSVRKKFVLIPAPSLH